MSSQSDVQSRLHNTRMHGFDQILSLSQNNVNDSFEFLFQNNEALRKIKIDNDEGTLDATMNSPTVEFVVKDAHHKAFFSLHFKSGTFEYYIRANKHTKSVANCVFVFASNLNLKELEAKDIPPNIKKAIIRPGSYSVSQLFFDFQSSDISSYDDKRTRLPGFDDSARAHFFYFINLYTQKLKKDHLGILGYAVTIPKDPQATFPPTSVQFQTYGYRVGEKPPVENHGHNQLLFLEMTGGRPFPTVILPWSGNWLIPQMAGTMAISKQNFWSRYLLPKLEIINRKTIARIESVNVEQLDTTWGVKYDDPNLNASWKSGGNSANFDYQSSKSDRQTVHPPNTHGIVFEAKGNSTVANHLQWNVGGDTIQVNGRTFVRVELSRTAYLPSGNFTTSSFAEVATVWNFDITLRSVHNGGLEVKILRNNIQSFPNSGATLRGTKTQEHADKAKDELGKNMASHINLGVWNEIEKDLNGQNQFVFPGGGTFDMKNPIFSAEGNLLVELNYKQ